MLELMVASKRLRNGQFESLQRPRNLSNSRIMMFHARSKHHPNHNCIGIEFEIDSAALSERQCDFFGSLSRDKAQMQAHVRTDEKNMFCLSSAPSLSTIASASKMLNSCPYHRVQAPEPVKNKFSRPSAKSSPLMLHFKRSGGAS